MPPPRWLRQLMQNIGCGRFLREAQESLGDRGEAFAEKHLRKLGYQILGRQVRLPNGELDLIARDNKTIVFIEVKTRRSNRYGEPIEAVSPTKQRRISRLAIAWLKQRNALDQSARFDVIGLLWPDESQEPSLHHVQNAFDLID